MSAARIVELVGQTLVEVRGADRAAFLHNLCTNDVRGLKPGTGCEAFFTNVQGKILAFANVLCEEDAIVLETVSGQAEMLLAHLDRYLIREDVELRDRTDEWSEILVEGEGAADVLKAVTESEPPVSPWGSSVGEMFGRQIGISRLPLVGSSGWTLRCEADAVPALLAALVDAGAVATDVDTFNVLRMEAGFPLYGRDITDANFPQEVGRDDTAISFVKGCYLGQETVARIDAVGHVNKMLCGVRFTDAELPAIGTSLSREGAEVGTVTSAVCSAKLGSPLALAYVRRGHEVVGTRLTTEAGEAEVVSLPL